ncbi:hypothetical protein KC19_6G020700, partial [Ceratodon purpureus]
MPRTTPIQYALLPSPSTSTLHTPAPKFPLHRLMNSLTPSLTTLPSKPPHLHTSSLSQILLTSTPSHFLSASNPPLANSRRSSLTLQFPLAPPPRSHHCTDSPHLTSPILLLLLRHQRIPQNHSPLAPTLHLTRSTSSHIQPHHHRRLNTQLPTHILTPPSLPPLATIRNAKPVPATTPRRPCSWQRHPPNHTTPSPSSAPINQPSSSSHI